MAIPLVIPNTVQVRLLWGFIAQGGVNVLHGIATGGVTVNQALADSLGSAIKTSFTTFLSPIFTANSQLVKVGVRDLRIANQAEYLDSAAAASGVVVGESLPSQLACCLTLRTAKSGKSFRGRVYVGGFAEASNDANGLILSTAQAAAVNFINSVGGAMTTAGLTLAVASRPAERYETIKTVFHSDGSTTVETIARGLARGGTSEPVTEIVSRNLAWETQRRRNNGRGGSGAALFASGFGVRL